MLNELIVTLEKEIAVYEHRLNALRSTLDEIRQWDENSFNNYVFQLQGAIKFSKANIRLSRREREVSLRVKDILESGKPFTAKQLFESVASQGEITDLNYANFRYMLSQKFLKAGILDRFELTGKIENDLRYWYADPFLFVAPHQPKKELIEEIKKALKALNKEISDHDIMSSWD